MSNGETGFRKSYSLKNFQEDLARRMLSTFQEKKRSNIFLSLPQGTGKTVVALYVLSKLINSRFAGRVLVLLPRRTLVDQWVEEARKLFYGLPIMKNPTLSQEEIGKIRGWLSHSKAIGMAMTVHSFKNYFRKEYFTEDDFDIVIVDEAADLVISKDFIQGFRMSSYLKGLEEWPHPKMLLLPYHVSEKKIHALLRKFGESSTLIREVIDDPQFEQLQYTVRDPVTINDPPINVFAEILDKQYRKTKTNVHRILNKYGIEGYRENIATLVNPVAMKRLKAVYHIDEETEQQLQTLIIKYIQISHIMKWFLYSNRDDLSRSILSSQKLVTKWLDREDKKLAKLKEVVEALLAQERKVYIFAHYVRTAKLITEYLEKELSLKRRDVVVVTGADTDQYLKLDSFKKVGRILVATPVFDEGTDIPEADVMIVFTPPQRVEKLFQITGRIRGGDIIFLAYEGYESDRVELLVTSLRKAMAESRGEKPWSF